MSATDPKPRLTEWFRQWRGPLRKSLVGRSAISASELDDVAQEVFLRLIRYDRTELIEHPQAYLYKMAANVAAEWSIRARYSRPHEAKWLSDLIADDQIEDAAVLEQLQGEIERALMTLSPRHREALKLQFYDSLSRSKIAERLGLTERTVKRLLLEGYERLRQQLDPGLLTGTLNGRE